VEVTDFFRELEPGCCGELALYYQVKGEYKPAWVCAIRKTEDAKMKGIERLKARNHLKSPRKPV
jgi:hypothetical protein